MTPLPELDPVIHAAARLRVVATLAALEEGDRLAFPRLQKILAMTAGNLSTHLRRLEEAGYVRVDKGHRGRTPSTDVALTARGRRAMEDYSAALRSMLPPEPARPTAATPAAASHDVQAEDVQPQDGQPQDVQPQDVRPQDVDPGGVDLVPLEVGR